MSVTNTKRSSKIANVNKSYGRIVRWLNLLVVFQTWPGARLGITIFWAPMACISWSMRVVSFSRALVMWGRREKVPAPAPAPWSSLFTNINWNKHSHGDTHVVTISLYYVYGDTHVVTISLYCVYGDTHMVTISLYCVYMVTLTGWQFHYIVLWWHSRCDNFIILCLWWHSHGDNFII